MAAIITEAHPRVGLLGNPSDLYAGRVLGFTFTNFVARVRVEAAEGIELLGSEEPLRVPASVPFAGNLDPCRGRGGAELLAAALKRLVGDHPRLEEHSRGLRASFETDIPRQAGLSGSSALVVAALRAYSQHFELPLNASELARLAQEAESEELGLIAGPQDRVLQAHRGLLAMDFGDETPRVTRLDPEQLPPLLVGWDPAPGRPSGDVHAAVLERWTRGDPDVRRVMSELRELVDEGVQALADGNHDRMISLMNANFELRQSVFPIEARDQDLVTLGRDVGAGAKLCGSGGAVVFVHSDQALLGRLAQSISQAGWGALFPQVIGGDS
jgi:glucuronokinase